MAMADELMFNCFYQALQEKRFHKKFDTAQDKGYLVCVPASESISAARITEDFVDTHILKPSPYFKGQYVTTDAEESRVVELDEGEIKSLSGFKNKFSIKILSEERGYNKKFEPYILLVIERPLESVCETDATNAISLLSEAIREFSSNKGISQSRSKQFLSILCNSEVMNNLDLKVDQFRNHYILLPGYIENAKEKLQSIWKAGCQVVARNLREGVSNDCRVWPLISEAVESYILAAVYDKLFPTIAKSFIKEDELVASKLLFLHTCNVSATQLGANKAFCCPLPAAVVELATLDGLVTPSEKMQCMKNTIDLVTAEVKQHLQEAQGLFTPSDKLPCLVADDLIPVLLTVIAQAKLPRLASNIFYVENFMWSLSPRDALSYVLVTFKAAYEFVKMNDFSKLQPPSSPMKKELSLEELMQVTERLQIKERENPTTERGRFNSWSPADRQLDRITKMIEASTRELSEVQDQGIPRKPK